MPDAVVSVSDVLDAVHDRCPRADVGALLVTYQPGAASSADRTMRQRGITAASAASTS
ncbi:hypothetical protein [Nocardia niwae]|uniref:Uncharacterized protein n=1 Tax=Nocardia niwae TaxID=626084 RepID=A0ABV2XE67_9NOCA|nr:hypothetical protein [Nocardia niwae]